MTRPRRTSTSRFAERFRGVAGHPYEPGFDLTLRPERVEQPRTWRRPRLIFVNSMSDLFHEGVPRNYIGRVFDTMETADWHVYQVLTKRSAHSSDSDHPFRCDADHRFHAFRSPSRSEATRVSHYGVK